MACSGNKWWIYTDNASIPTKWRDAQTKIYSTFTIDLFKNMFCWIYFDCECVPEKHANTQVNVEKVRLFFACRYMWDNDCRASEYLSVFIFVVYIIN